jgi:formylglycine-generating enzyme
MSRSMCKVLAALFLSACFAISAWSQSAGPQVSRGCRDCPEMMIIPAGTFTMGSPANEPGHDVFLSESPQRRVNISQFAVGKFDVTRGQWAAFASTTNRDTRAGCFSTGLSGMSMDPDGSL